MAMGKGKLSKTFIWILMGLLIVGLAGFGATSLSGSARSVATVGEKEVSTDAYLRALRTEINAFSAQAGRAVPMSEAQMLGLDRQVLAQLITARGLDNEASQIGLSVGDDVVAEQLLQVPSFQGPDGSFNREAYSFALRNQGLSETEFEEQLRDDTARTVLQSALIAGNTLPDTYIDTLLAYAGETRDFTWARLTGSALQTGLPEPSEADLEAYYEDNLDNYTLPELRDITYAWIAPEMIVDTVEVDEDALRAAYDERIDEFNLPERRLVERLVFSNEDAATDALARLNEDFSFEDLVEDRGLSMSDIDMGDVTREALGDAADGVFAAETGAVVGPLPSSLGPALYRVNAVLDAQSTSFEDARPDLRGELALDRARRVIDTLAQSIDDELAAGATLEEIADTTEAELGQIDWFPGSDGEIAAYDAFREAASALSEGDFPAVLQLGDGGIFAMRLNRIQPPAPQPIEDVIDQVRQGWDTREQTAQLMVQAEELTAALANGSTFEDLGLAPQSETDLGRNAQIADLDPGLLSAVFEMAPADTRAITGVGEVILIRLDEVNPVDRSDADIELLAQALRNQASNSIAEDLFRAFAGDVQRRAGVQVNQPAINAVHAAIQ
ncbi:peptidyl-prolyl cis-trans isomerase [Marivita geojedonensis]|uniref:Peptidylprolyl isomerase n=1 Tax=Marivita geojedonensis TaxID=1123756 RepID=A0A1X4NIM3_9RHOB|nr:SurA N-terminal domain-containing protein [Marivita geojedonensis]OSQ48590.1 peptidylprolyl isomerase [Marivita geojedonensis]PRY75137.1 peptidyl-prolyl cis-trans isomerase D [Marivita geojedonensis]